MNSHSISIWPFNRSTTSALLDAAEILKRFHSAAARFKRTGAVQPASPRRTFGCGDDGCHYPSTRKKTRSNTCGIFKKSSGVPLSANAQLRLLPGQIALDSCKIAFGGMELDISGDYRFETDRAARLMAAFRTISSLERLVSFFA